MVALNGHPIRPACTRVLPGQRHSTTTLPRPLHAQVHPIGYIARQSTHGRDNDGIADDASRNQGRSYVTHTNAILAAATFGPLIPL